MTANSIGEQELALLRHIADSGGASVASVVDAFGAERELARSTVLTMMERLRKKGFLARKLVKGIYVYRAQRSSAELLQSAVARFVERHLGGSVSPFFAYLSDTNELSDDEFAELEGIVGRLKSERKKDRRPK